MAFAINPKKGNTRRAPPRLKKTCAPATRFASVLLPMTDKPAVTQVPTLAPKIKAKPAGKEINCCVANAITTPMVAELD